MKRLGFALALGCMTLAAGDASAESFVKKFDPSGAPMCFDQGGNKAALSSCERPVVLGIYIQAKDPSGAVQCFDSQGEKAPLARCSTPASKVAVREETTTTKRLASNN